MSESKDTPSTTHQRFIADYVAAARRIRVRLGNPDAPVSEARILKEMDRVVRRDEKEGLR